MELRLGTIKAERVKRLNTFHNRCIRTILGVTRWKELISSRELAAAFGMEESIADILMAHRLPWLGHFGMNGAREDAKAVAVRRIGGEETKPWYKEEMVRCCEVRSAGHWYAG